MRSRATGTGSSAASSAASRCRRPSSAAPFALGSRQAEDEVGFRAVVRPVDRGRHGGGLLPEPVSALPNERNLEDARHRNVADYDEPPEIVAMNVDNRMALTEFLEHPDCPL